MGIILGCIVVSFCSILLRAVTLYIVQVLPRKRQVQQGKIDNPTIGYVFGKLYDGEAITFYCCSFLPIINVIIFLLTLFDMFSLAFRHLIEKINNREYKPK